MGGGWSQQIYYSKARDMARFGLLNLNKGIWNTDTLMKDSMYFKAMVNTSQTLNNSYGYLWWLNGKSSFMAPQSQLVLPGPLMSNAPTDMFCALGKNDQKIYVVPSQGLVVVRQGNSAGGFSLAASAFDNVLWDYINKLNCSLASIKTNTFEQLISVFPNPVQTKLTIDNIAQSIYKIKVYSVFGNQVYEATNIKTQAIDIDFSDFSQGIYIVETEDVFKNIARQKIIKQ